MSKATILFRALEGEYGWSETYYFPDVAATRVSRMKVLTDFRRRPLHKAYDIIGWRVVDETVAGLPSGPALHGQLHGEAGRGLYHTADRGAEPPFVALMQRWTTATGRRRMHLLRGIPQDASSGRGQGEQRVDFEPTGNFQTELNAWTQHLFTEGVRLRTKVASTIFDIATLTIVNERRITFTTLPAANGFVVGNQLLLRRLRLPYYARGRWKVVEVAANVVTAVKIGNAIAGAYDNRGRVQGLEYALEAVFNMENKELVKRSTGKVSGLPVGRWSRPKT